MSETEERDEGPLVNFWGAIFYVLKWLSLSKILLSGAGAAAGALGMKLPRKWQSPWIDAWVVLNLVLAGCCLFAAVTWNYAWLGPSILIYGTSRLVEIVVAQINVLLFDAYYHDRRYAAGKEKHPYVVRGHRRLVVILVHNVVEIAMWLDAALVVLDGLGFGEIKQFEGQVYELPALVGRTIIAFVTFNNESLLGPGHGAFGALAAAQPFVGIFLVLVMLARFLSSLPQPLALVDQPKVK